MSKVVAVLACRNNGTRLYGKPLQLLGKDSVLGYMIGNLKMQSSIHEIVLAISNAKGNEIFADIAEKHNIKYIFGDDTDVLGRLITACQKTDGDIVFRVTTESPFTYLEGIQSALENHVRENAEYTTFANLPDGVTFELINLAALIKSHQKGENKHRSELCSLYINENKHIFNVNILHIEKDWERPDYRLTIDYPEDLILCRKVITYFGDDKPIPYADLIRFLDANPTIRDIVNNLTDSSYVRYKN